MKKNEVNEFRSICDLKKRFFPNDKTCKKTTNNITDLGIELSQKSLDKIKIKISNI